MKLKTFISILTLALGAFVGVSCGDDELEPQKQEQETPQDPKNEVNQEVVGTYTGWSHLVTTFINKDYANNTLTLALAEDGTLTATYVNGVWGTATIKGVNASKDSETGAFQLAGGEGSFVMNNPRDNSTQEYACNLQSGTISADKKDVTVIILANMTTAGAHGEMTFTFQTGEVPTENE